ncbi:MAG: RnfABCDGE type electron transport complex subunit B [Acidobacteria bacterium]|nr:MAG: RnfABCDGE type electron transport complex subunit B [Acidobacteriota bacterium]
MLGIAGFFGVVLALADRWLRVEEDPRIEEVERRLPNSNCGACGRPGCRAFAEALVGGEAQPAECTVSAPEAVEAIAAFLGVSVGRREKRVARLHCAGGRLEVRKLADYHGIPSCRAAFVVNGGGRACPWGCLGFGDCERACSFGAIHMNDDELPVVDPDRCTACNDCVVACPLDLFTLEPITNRVIVQCSAPLTGAAARMACGVACDGCGRCAADAPEGAIEMRGGLPVIVDPKRLDESVTFRCPTGAIRWVEGRQFDEEAPPLEAAGGRRG